MVEPIVLFVGWGRSGTSLIRAMFDSHPAMAVTHEARFLSTMGRARRRYERDAQGGERLRADLLANASFRQLGITADELAAVLPGAAVGDVPDALRKVLHHYAAVRGKTRVGDKTPAHLTRIALLAHLLPEARVVHIIRDGRDCLAAFRDRGFGIQDASAAALTWSDRVRRARRAGARLGPERYREVRYEDLVERPEPVLRELCGFVGLDFDPAMLAFHERTEAVVAGARQWTPSMFDRLNRPVEPAARDWRSELSARDIAVFNARAARVLLSCGYAVSSRGSARERAAALRARVRYTARRAWVGGGEATALRLLGRGRRRS